MKKNTLVAIFITCLFGLLLITLFNLWKKSVEPNGVISSLERRESMEKVGLPVINTKDIKGRDFNLASYRGKLVLVNFWASWCGPCVEEFPSMISLVQELKGDLVLVAISNDSNREDIDNFLIHHKGWESENVFIVWDQNREISASYGVDRLPESFLANAEGLLVKKISGSIDWHTSESVSYLKQLFSSKK